MSQASLPSNLKHVALFFERLPGIGAKTANRLAFYLLRLPEKDLKLFAQSLSDLKESTKRCHICNNLTETETCAICENPQRDKTLITVVEDVIDLLSFEQGNIYNGVYHVLHGKIDPLNRVGPEDIFLDSLFKRVRATDPGYQVTEIILATNPDMEGEATAMYIRDRLKAIQQENKSEPQPAGFPITRLGYGLPIGANLEYTDYMTLRKALEGRKGF